MFQAPEQQTQTKSRHEFESLVQENYTDNCNKQTKKKVMVFRLDIAKIFEEVTFALRNKKM